MFSIQTSTIPGVLSILSDLTNEASLIAPITLVLGLVIAIFLIGRIVRWIYPDAEFYDDDDFYSDEDFD